jgi:hypothetical protein
MMALPARPDGLAAVISTFGDPHKYLDNPAAWEAVTLALVRIPHPLIYAIDTGQLINRIRAHHLLVEHLADTLMACLAAGVPPGRLKYGGAYCWRLKRGVAQLSMHAYGIAVDLEPLENPLGQAWVDDGVMLDPHIIEVFEARGWFGGYQFKDRSDPGHWQWVLGC